MRFRDNVENYSMFSRGNRKSETETGQFLRLLVITGHMYITGGKTPPRNVHCEFFRGMISSSNIDDVYNSSRIFIQKNLESMAWTDMRETPWSWEKKKITKLEM